MADGALMPRSREFTGKVRKSALARSNYRCEWVDDTGRCEIALVAGGVEYDHVLPMALGGESTLENCQALCSIHHKLKTSVGDIPRIRKADRQGAVAFGTKTRRGPPMRGRKFEAVPKSQKRLSSSKQMSLPSAIQRMALRGDAK